MARSCEPMNKNRIEGVAEQGERAKYREALVIKALEARGQTGGGQLPPVVVQQRRGHQARADHGVLRPAGGGGTVLTANSRTARCGPAYRVVWQGCL